MRAETSFPKSRNPLNLDGLSPRSRIVLDTIIERWLESSVNGQGLVAGLSRAGAKAAVYELIGKGAVVVAVNGPPDDPRSSFSLQLTDFGKAIGRGQVS